MANAAAENKSHRPLSPHEISLFCSQMSLILHAGIQIHEGISILYEDTQDFYGKALVGEIAANVEQGKPLYAALLESGCFPKYMVDMVRIGEASGRLEQVMESLVDYYERSESTSKSIKNAVTYPLVMVVMMLFTVLVLVIKVLPIFQQVFSQLGGDMMSFSKSIMDFGTVLASVSLILLGLILLFAIIFYILRGTDSGRRRLSIWFDSFPLTQSLAGKIASGRFASAMALMLSSGLDMDTSMELAGNLVSNPKISQKIGKCQEQLANGVSFSEALTKSEIFSVMSSKMISLGFVSGSMDGVMRRIADRYEDEITDKISVAISILEPTMVAALSVVIGVILISVMLPLMGVMSSIG